MADAVDPLDVAARALRHRDRSRRQVDERLERAGVAEDARADALETLERVGYVDDDRYAATRASTLAARGYGDDGIRQLLSADGVAEEAVESALAVLAPERERAAALVERLGPSARTFGRLRRHGFREDAIESAGGFAEDRPEA